MCFPQKRSTGAQIKGWQGQLEGEASAHPGLGAAPTHLPPASRATRGWSELLLLRGTHTAASKTNLVGSQRVSPVSKNDKEAAPAGW